MSTTNIVDTTTHTNDRQSGQAATLTFYSRIGFVHEFRPLDEAQMTRLLNERWLPAGVRHPDAVFAPDVIATLIRMSGGNFRLPTRLLTQVERILKVNQTEIVSKEIVTAARDILAIGQG